MVIQIQDRELREERIFSPKKKRLRNTINSTEKERLRNESDPSYQQWQIEQEAFALFELQEIQSLNEQENEKWMRAELIAQTQWRELQKKISKAKLERAEQEIKIKKEWEQEQGRIKQIEEKIKKSEEEQRLKYEQFIEKLEEYLSGNGEVPDELLKGSETNPDAVVCPFFFKTAACRFGDSCSRNHKSPGISKVLLAPHLYTHFGLENSQINEYDTDILLEYEEGDTYRHFKDFFYDVLPEFEKWGQVVQFRVCNNQERHLRGNTYIEFSSAREAVAAHRALHTRWYGGKQLSLHFCTIPSWKAAICGMFLTRKCPKGRACNFLHVFRNPRNMFGNFSRNQGSQKIISRDKENCRNWRWSESPEVEIIGEKREFTKRSERAKRDKHRETRSYSSERRHKRSSNRLARRQRVTESARSYRERSEHDIVKTSSHRKHRQSPKLKVCSSQKATSQLEHDEKIKKTKKRKHSLPDLNHEDS